STEATTSMKMNSVLTMRAMFATEAPSTLRTPISFMRRIILSDTRVKSPVADSIIALTPRNAYIRTRLTLTSVVAWYTSDAGIQPLYARLGDTSFQRASINSFSANSFSDDVLTTIWE